MRIPAISVHAHRCILFIAGIGTQEGQKKLDTHPDPGYIYAGKGKEVLEGPMKEGLEQEMICHSCGVIMVPGVAMIPIWGTLNGRPLTNGTTLNHISASIQPVMKCPDCGRSISFEKEIIFNHQEKD